MNSNSHQTLASVIRSRLNEFKPAERKIASHLLNNYPMAGLASITALSTACGVSAPTVMRMLKRIGYSSFVSFQNTLKEEVARTLADPIAKHDQWATDTPREHILNQSAETVVSNLQSTLNFVSHDDFDRVVDLLSDQQHAIHLVGGRITSAFAGYLCTHLEVIRKNTFRLPDSVGLWPHHLLNVEQGDVLLILDIRRYEADLLNLARMAHNKGAEVILLTDQWMSPVSEFASYSFCSHIEAPSGWDSGVAILYLIEAMITAVERKLWPSAAERMRELEQNFDVTGRFRQLEK